MATTRVTYEQAVKLKETGFAEKVQAYWYIGDTGTNIDLLVTKGCWDNYNYDKLSASAPTLHEAADHLRTKGLHVAVFPDVNMHAHKWSWHIYRLVGYVWIFFDSGGNDHNTHDTSLSAAITHALTLLTNQNGI